MSTNLVLNPSKLIYRAQIGWFWYIATTQDQKYLYTSKQCHEMGANVHLADIEVRPNSLSWVYHQVQFIIEEKIFNRSVIALAKPLVAKVAQSRPPNHPTKKTDNLRPNRKECQCLLSTKDLEEQNVNS